jgi:hypothetical protein
MRNRVCSALVVCISLLLTASLTSVAQPVDHDQILLGASIRGTSVFVVSSDLWVAQEFTLSERTKLSTVQLPMGVAGAVKLVLTDGLSSSAHIYSTKTIFGNFAEATVVIAWQPSITLEAGTYYLVFMGADQNSRGGLISSDGTFFEPDGNSVGHVYSSPADWDAFNVSPYPSILFQISGKEKKAN